MGEIGSQTLKSVFKTQEEALSKAINLRDDLDYVANGKESNVEKEGDSIAIIPSINTLDSWAHQINNAITDCQKIMDQLRS